MGWAALGPRLASPQALHTAWPTTGPCPPAWHSLSAQFTGQEDTKPPHCPLSRSTQSPFILCLGAICTLQLAEAPFFFLFFAYFSGTKPTEGGLARPIPGLCTLLVVLSSHGIKVRFWPFTSCKRPKFRRQRHQQTVLISTFTTTLAKKLASR